MSIAKKTFNSSFLIIIMRAIQRSIGIVSLLILARLLTPEDFGLVAVATMLVFLCDVLSESGAQQYIVQKEEIDDTDLNTAWSINLLLKLFLAITLMIAAPWVATFFETPNLTFPLQVLSLILPITALASPGIHVLKRNLDYKLFVRLSVAEKLGSFAVTISLAYYLQSYWAMIIGVVASYCIHVIGSYVIAPFSPKFTLIRLKLQWTFSQWMLLKALLGYLKSEFDTVFVTKVFSIDAIGGFNMMKNLSAIPGREIIQPVSEPLLAAFSKVKQDSKALNFQVLTSLTLLLTLTTPLVGMLYNFDEHIIRLLLDEKWYQYAPLLGLLSFFILNFSLVAVFQQALTCLAKVKLLFYYNVVTFIMILIYFLVFFTGDLAAFAFARVVLAMIFLAMMFLLVWWILKFNFFDFIAMLGPVLVANLAASYSIVFYAIDSEFLFLVVCCSVYLVTYIASYLLCLFVLKRNKASKRFQEWVLNFVRSYLKKNEAS